MVKHVTLYINEQCPLCDEAIHSLRLAAEDVPMEMTITSIQSDDALHMRYMLEVPVLLIDGQEVLRGAIGYGDIMERLLEE